MSLIKKYGLPVVVAINKTDRDNSDPETVMLDLADHGIDVEQLGGDSPCALISALNKIGLDILEEKVIKLAEKLNLKEDHEINAECLIVESHVDEETSQVTGKFHFIFKPLMSL
jgi:translation initiation factor IF-2